MLNYDKNKCHNKINFINFIINNYINFIINNYINFIINNYIYK